MIRSFVAIDPHPDVCQRLVEIRRELASAGADVRWVRDEGLHCTIKFLGSVEEEQLQRVHTALEAALASLSSILAHARGLGVFPTGRNPRVVWAGLEDDAARLPELASRVENALVPLGFPAEGRRFHPHVTLGRVRSRGGWRALAELMRRHEKEDFGDTNVERVVVYQSQPQSGGSVYTPLWSVPLTN